VYREFLGHAPSARTTVCVALWGVSLEIDCVADAVAVNRALAQIRPGDVLVIDTGGDYRHAPVGAVTSCAARCARAVAVIGQALASDQAEPRLLERLRV
jgi:regulator of RNase E activity RraA